MELFNPLNLHEADTMKICLPKPIAKSTHVVQQSTIVNLNLQHLVATISSKRQHSTHKARNQELSFIHPNMTKMKKRNKFYLIITCREDYNFYYLIHNQNCPSISNSTQILQNNLIILQIHININELVNLKETQNS